MNASRFRFRAWCLMSSGRHEMIYSPELPLDKCINKGSEIAQFVDAILMQSTGLCDKSGKEIFEGDILQQTEEKSDDLYGDVKWNVFSQHEVVWLSENVFESPGWNLPHKVVERWEVIGNIYENPELTSQSETTSPPRLLIPPQDKAEE